ncbi:AAA family ATPase [uncultured Litoreibacter sp.]|uniref:AAA family ATPase n=1 Tax=uncultured Litoreibacter sp. TaxID=1392394 RepID=UPI00262BA340|nr:AAA family ATPase [uncultured Litoreibacter sp.]
MSNDNEGMVFRSHRPGDAQAVAAPQVEATNPTPKMEPNAPTEQVSGVRILVISDNNGLGQMIGAALGADAETKVDYARNALADLKDQDPAFLEGYNIVVFEAHPGNDLELHSLRKLTAIRPEGTKFLAMTAGELTLAYAKELMEVGVDEVLPLSAIRPDLQDTVSLEPHVDKEVARRDTEDKNGVIIGMSQTRGGIGATSLALALAYQMSLAPKKKKKAEPAPYKRVAVVDFDIQNGTLGAYVDVEDNGRVIEMLRAGILPSADELKAMMGRYAEAFDVLPAPTEFAPIDALSPEMVATLLDELRYAYDVVIVDLPRVVSDWMEPVLARADQIVLVTDTAVPSIRQARRLIDFYTEDHVNLQIEIVIGMEKKKFSLSEGQKEAAAILERPFTHWLPREDGAAQKANDTGKPVTEIAARSSLAKAIVVLGEAIEKAHSDGIRRRA